MIYTCPKIFLVLVISIISTSGFGQFLVSGSSSYSTGNFISPTTTGGTYVVGNYICNLSIDTLSVGRDSCPKETSTPLNFYLLKLNAQGEALWLKSSNISRMESKYTIYGAFTDATDNLWIAGNFSDSLCIENQGIKSMGSNDVFVARFHPNGSLDTLIGNFSYDVSSAIYLAGFTSDFSGNALLYGAFNGSMKSSADTITHSNSQLFLAKIDAFMQSEFLITKLDTPIISCDSSSIRALAGNGTKLKMAISVDNGKEYRIDTSYILNLLGSDIMVIDTNLVVIAENTVIAEKDASNNFQYLLRTDCEQLTSLVFDTTGNYYLLDNVHIGGDENIQVDKYNSANGLQWSHKTSNNSSSIILKGKTLTADPNGNVYYGGYFQATSTNRSFAIAGNTLTANKDKIALAVKLDPNKNCVWVQTLGTTTSIDDEVAQNHDVLSQMLALSETNVLATGYFGNELSIAGLQVINTDGANNLFAGTLDPYPDFMAEITTSGNPEICFGDSVLLQASTANEYSYQWTKNGNDIPGANASRYYAKDSAIYGLLIYNTDLNYTKKAQSLTITVNPIPSAVIETTDDTIFCLGNSALLHAVNTSGYSYRWYNNSTAISEATQNAYTAKSSGDYHLLITSDKACSNTSNTITIEVLTPTAQITNTGDLNICDGDSIKLEAYTENDYQYQWYFEGDTLINDTLTFMYAKISGAYQVQTTILGSCQSLSVDANISVTPSPPAEISFSGDSVICFGEQTALAANTGFNLTYFWMLNNDTIPGENNSWITTETEGVYTAIVGYEGSCSRWSNNKTLVVNTLPAVIMQLDGDTNICEGQETKLSTHFQTTYAYQWYRNNIEITDATSNFIMAQKTGTYFARVTNEFGCNKDTPYQSMVVKSAPDASLFYTGDTSFCEKQSVELFTYNLPNQTYQWYKNGTSISNQTSYAFITTETGNYQVLVINIQNQCESASRVIETIMIPAPDEKIVASKDIPFCEGDSVLFSVSSHLDWKYQWLYNGYQLYQDTLAQLSAKQAGNYSVEVTNNYHCSATAPVVLLSLLDNPVPSINVNGLFLSTNENGALLWNYNGEPIAGATNPLFLVEQSGLYSVTAHYSNGCFSTSPTVSVCNPVPEISVDESFLTANEGEAYQWFFEDEKIEGAKQQTHRAQVSGNYTVEVTCTGIYTSESAPVLVCIPVPKITQTASNVLESTQGNSYQWYKDGQQLEGEDARVLVIKSSGEYTVWVEDLEGCASFTKPFYLYYSSVEEISSPIVLKIYPNPVRESIFIEYIGSRFEKPTQIEISDISGKIIYRLDHILKNKQIEVSVKDFVPGLYWVSLKTESGMLFSKFVKQ